MKRPQVRTDSHSCRQAASNPHSQRPHSWHPRHHKPRQGAGSNLAATELRKGMVAVEEIPGMMVEALRACSTLATQAGNGFELSLFIN